MRKWMCDNKGETLIEVIVSLVLYAVFMTAITNMINTSLRITNTSTQNAQIVQQEINPVTLSDYSSYETKSVIFEITDIYPNISAKHNVRLNTGGGIIAFSPEEAY